MCISLHDSIDLIEISYPVIECLQKLHRIHTEIRTFLKKERKDEEFSKKPKDFSKNTENFHRILRTFRDFWRFSWNFPGKGEGVYGKD